MNERDALMCIRHGADIVGFVVDYPNPVPWNLDLATAVKLIAAVSEAGKTCIVTGGTPDKVIKIAHEAKPDYIQLHYRESLEDTKSLVAALAKQDIKVIKTLFPDTPDLIQAAKDFCATGVFALLFDARVPENAAFGGSPNLTVFNELQASVDCPVILAGGITSENVAAMIEETNTPIIDLMSGVEQYPGNKDETQISLLFQALDHFV